MNTNERPFFISKDVLDTINSASWFLMDAMWMLQMEQVSVGMIVPTIASGVCLVYIEKRKTLTLINLAILSWICMNVSWMFSEVLEIPLYLSVAKSLFGLGLSFILAAVFVSGSLTETFSHFKRFRILEKLRKSP
jgi:hypothetical protein